MNFRPTPKRLVQIAAETLLSNQKTFEDLKCQINGKPFPKEIFPLLLGLALTDKYFYVNQEIAKEKDDTGDERRLATILIKNWPFANLFFEKCSLSYKSDYKFMNFAFGRQLRYKWATMARQNYNFFKIVFRLRNEGHLRRNKNIQVIDLRSDWQGKRAVDNHFSQMENSGKSANFFTKIILRAFDLIGEEHIGNVVSIKSLLEIQHFN